MCGEVHARRSRPMCFWYHCRRQPRITLNDTRYTMRWLYVSGDAETSAEFNMSAVCSGRQKCERPGSFFTLQTKQCHTIGRNITDVMTLQEEMSTRNTDGTIKKKGYIRKLQNLGVIRLQRTSPGKYSRSVHENLPPLHSGTSADMQTHKLGSTELITQLALMGFFIEL